MWRWSLILLTVALIAALLGVTAIAGTAGGMARALFFAFLALLVASAFVGAAHGRPPR